tara:strand:+ start:110 stop:415 length:306 start_codon:yes stop_codon:yes gene_type:complete
MTDNLAIIRTYAQTLTDADLARAWRILYEEHQQRGEVNAKELKGSLKKGDIVEWTGRNGTVTGEVHRVKRKKVIVLEMLGGKPDFGSRWDIPMTMLRKIQK